jgi:isocitrate dehydrogenase kinase/phosphatase
MEDVTTEKETQFIRIVKEDFHRYCQAFEQSTCGNKARFEARRWKEQRQALQERTDLLEQLVAQTALQLKTGFTHPIEPKKSLILQKAFLAQVDEAGQSMAHCFWQSLLPELLPASWYDQFTPPETTFSIATEELRCYTGEASLQKRVQRLLTEIGFEVPFGDLEGDASWISQQLVASGVADETAVIAVLQPLFYRNQHAYLLGHIQQGQITSPLAIAFIHPTEGIRADAVLLSESSIKGLFAFSRSYFLVETSDPIGMVRFLYSILPSKPLEQLFINIGFAQYGKTLLYYHLLRHVEQVKEKFTYPPGIPGMVMMVFTLPTFPVVIKVLRDYFKPPKTVSRREVTEKYQFIAHHDRVGRLADAQRFSSLVLPEEAFEAGLLEELVQEAAQSVRIENGQVLFSLAYLERKMIPLDVFLQESSPDLAMEVIIDYGQAIREIAMSNVFPGDLLLKNFGVTPEYRVVFYDYDEIVPLTVCDFRSIPSARYEEDEMDAEPWFAGGENHIFPEELSKFLIPSGALKDAFCRVHGDLFTPQFWNEWKTFFESGGITDLPPYESSRTLAPT